MNTNILLTILAIIVIACIIVFLSILNICCTYISCKLRNTLIRLRRMGTIVPGGSNEGSNVEMSRIETSDLANLHGTAVTALPNTEPQQNEQNGLNLNEIRKWSFVRSVEN